jgi:hypothetical protein
MTSPASFLAAHAPALPVAADLDSLFRAIDPMHGGKPALASHESYVTIELEGRPLATLQRPRVIGEGPAPVFTLCLTDGRLVAAFSSCPSEKRALEAVYSYLRSGLPSEDCRAPLAEELESYRKSFAENWTMAQDAAYPVFRASAMTRCARWARRIALALAAMAEEEDAAEGFDGMATTRAYPINRPGPLALAAMRAAGLLIEAARPANAPGYGLRIVPRSGGFELHNDSGVWIGPGLGLFPSEEAARAWGEGRPAFGGGPRYWIKEEAPKAPAFAFPLAPRKAPAPLWPVAPRRAFAELAAVTGARC